jgi:hypothetical protein
MITYPSVVLGADRLRLKRESGKTWSYNHAILPEFFKSHYKFKRVHWLKTPSREDMSNVFDEDFVQLEKVGYPDHENPGFLTWRKHNDGDKPSYEAGYKPTDTISKAS